MPAVVALHHDYPYPSALVWTVATDMQYLQTVMQGLITFRGLPEGQIYAGQTVSVDVSLLGLMPYQPYAMHVTDFDSIKRRFVSSETGAGVKTWRHELHVIETQTGCRIDESITIDAGIMTPLFACWARFLYRKRHEPRLRILADLARQS